MLYFQSRNYGCLITLVRVTLALLWNVQDTFSTTILFQVNQCQFSSETLELRLFSSVLLFNCFLLLFFFPGKGVLDFFFQLSRLKELEPWWFLCHSFRNITSHKICAFIKIVIAINYKPDHRNPKYSWLIDLIHVKRNKNCMYRVYVGRYDHCQLYFVWNTSYIFFFVQVIFFF